MTSMPPMPLPDIEIEARPHYLAEQSQPEKDHYVFSYTITIINKGPQAAQLLSRHWVIIGAGDEVQEVRGPGVVGEQPQLQPGEGFEYTSGCILTLPVGSMSGSYQMVAADGREFEVSIPEFKLIMPRILH